MAVLGGIVRVLDRLGFAPRVVRRDGDGSALLHLHACPFLRLAQTDPEVVCGVHLGVVDGALRALGGRSVQAGLEPFGAPGACVLRLAAGRTAGPGPAR